MNISRRIFTASSLTLTWLSTLPGSQNAWAQTAGNNLTVLVSQPAGGVTDVFARGVAPALGKGVGRTVVVDNVPGASGSLAAGKLLAAPPDGHTIFVGSASETVLTPLTLKAVKYKPSDFRLLGLINNSPLALYARADLPASNLDELVALSKKSDKPLSYGSTGMGSLFHLQTELLLSATGMKATHVPYRGGMPMLTDLQGGSIDFTMLPVDALLGSMVSGGKMKVLGVTTAKRIERFPNAPTFDESRAAPDFGRPSIWVGLLVPSTMSERDTAQLHKVVIEGLGSADVRKAIDTAGGSVPAPMSLAELAAMYAADTSKLQALAKAANVEPQ